MRNPDGESRILVLARLLRFRRGMRMACNDALADEIRDCFRWQTENSGKYIRCVFAQQGRRLGLVISLRSKAVRGPDQCDRAEFWMFEPLNHLTLDNTWAIERLRYRFDPSGGHICPVASIKPVLA